LAKRNPNFSAVLSNLLRQKASSDSSETGCPGPTGFKSRNGDIWLLIQELPDFGLPDEAQFDLALGPKGQKLILTPEKAMAVRSRQRRYRQSKPLRIQALLRQACDLQDRLNREPGLTRDALAGEVGMDPSRLTQVLNLLSLAPEIRERILALPPSVSRGTVTERRLRPITRIQDSVRQLLEFERLLASPERFSGRVEVPMAGSGEGAPFFSSNKSSL